MLDGLVEYFKVSYGGHAVALISARSKYEAIGYYALETLNGTGYIDQIDVEVVSGTEKIEVSCVGFPVYETVEEKANKLDFRDDPQIICKIDS